jgi:putative transposase
MRKQFSATFKAQAVHELLKEEQSIAQLAAEYGVHPTQLGKWKALALKGLPSLFEERAEVGALKTAHEVQLIALYAEIGRLTTQVTWHKKNVACHRDRDARLALVERGQSALPLTIQADLLSLSRSSLYYHPRAPSLEEIAIKHRIDRSTGNTPATVRDGSRHRCDARA